jgi:hypothetical protein
VSVLSLNHPIPYFDTLKSLAGPKHPVYLIACDDGSHLVLKGDNTTSKKAGPLGLKHNLGAMRAVNPAGAGKVLSPQEMAVLQDYVDKSLAVTRLLRCYGEADDVVNLRNHLSMGWTWFKMLKVEGLVGLEGAIDALKHSKDKTGVRAFAASLNAPGGFERLGQIAAVDLYNGNTDRFTSKAGDGCTNPLTADHSSFKAIGNLANVLIGLQDGKVAPIGLDSFDPNGRFGQVTLTVDQMEAANPLDDLWSGRLLAPNAGAQRKKFAQDLFDDLQAALGPRNRKLFFLSKNRLKSNGAARILAGMEQAIPLLRQRLDRKLGRSNPLPGLASRRAVFS